ncbi:hypothetical protein ES708_28486 [subsurface metagenome]
MAAYVFGVVAGAGVEHISGRRAGAGDEALLAVDDVFVALAFGEGLDAGDVGAHGRLGHGHRPQLPLHHPGQEPLFLLLGAEVHHLVPAPQHGGAEYPAHAGHAADFLDDDAGSGGTQPHSPVLFGDAGAEVSLLGYAGEDVPGELPFPECFLSAGHNPIDEFAHLARQRLVLVTPPGERFHIAPLKFAMKMIT